MKKLLAHTFATMSLAFAVPPGAGAAETDIRSTAATANTAWNQALNSGNAAALAALYAEMPPCHRATAAPSADARPYRNCFRVSSTMAYTTTPSISSMSAAMSV